MVFQVTFVTLVLGTRMEVFYEDELIAYHPRSFKANGGSLTLDHYLYQLQSKAQN